MMERFQTGLRGNISSGSGDPAFLFLGQSIEMNSDSFLGFPFFHPDRRDGR